ASGLDRLQFDAFRSCYRRVRPRLATFFSNSTAHYQHFHWREMEPDKFKIKPSHAEMSTYRDTILFGYRAMEDLVGRFLGLIVDGRPALLALRRGTRIHSGCKIFHPLPGDTRLSVDGTQSSAPFFDLFYQVEGTKSGMHHPDGIFWIRTPARTHAVERERVPLAAVAPTILRRLSLSCPSQLAEAHHMGVLLGVLR